MEERGTKENLVGLKAIKKYLPGLFIILQSIYYRGLYILEYHILGTKATELGWRFRRIKNLEAVPGNHQHRHFMVHTLEKLMPFTSVLEVGCGTGANLITIGRSFPDVDLHGLDINRRAVSAAKIALLAENLGDKNISFGRADELRAYTNRSVDLVVTDACLMYVGPDKIGKTLAELTRVARLAVVCMEWDCEGAVTSGRSSLWHYGHWAHHYSELLRFNQRVDSVAVSRLPEGLWGQGGGWSKFGSIIVVELRP